MQYPIVLKTLIYPASGMFFRCSCPSFMKKWKSSALGDFVSVLCLSGWGSVMLLLIGKFVGIMFIAFVEGLLDGTLNSVGEDAFTKKAVKGGRA